MPLLMPKNKTKTEAECIECDDSYYHIYDGDLMCPQCFHTPPHEASRRVEGDGAWERFKRRTDEYSGFYGPERIRAVGGFPSAYLFDEDFPD